MHKQLSGQACRQAEENISDDDVNGNSRQHAGAQLKDSTLIAGLPVHNAAEKCCTHQHAGVNADIDLC